MKLSYPTSRLYLKNKYNLKPDCCRLSGKKKTCLHGDETVLHVVKNRKCLQVCFCRLFFILLMFCRFFYLSKKCRIFFEDLVFSVFLIFAIEDCRVRLMSEGQTLKAVLSNKG